MEQKSILYPLLALAAWTLLMAVVMIRRAFRAVGEGLNPEYFRYSKGFRPPGYMLSAYQHFDNLFEMPVLFYALLITIYITANNSVQLLTLSWGYVVMRIFHSLAHLSNRNVPLRRNFFIASYVILVLLWSVTAVELIG